MFCRVEVRRYRVEFVDIVLEGGDTKEKRSAHKLSRTGVRKGV